MTGPFLLFLQAVCPLLFFTDLTRNPYLTQVYLLQAGLLAALLTELAAAARRGVLSRRATALDVPVAAWAAVALVSWGASWLAHPSLRSSVAAEGFRNHFFLFTNLLLPFFLAAKWDDARHRRTMLAVGGIAAAYGLLQYFGIEWVWDKALNPYNGRPVSTFGNPNFLSSALVMLIPLALFEFMTAKPAARTGWGLLAALYGAALIATMTRSSWIGAAAAAAFFAAGVRPRGERLRSLALLGGGLALLAVFWPGSPLAEGGQSPVGRLVELARGVSGRAVYGSWHQRLLIWSCARDMLVEKPLLGKGWGCFELFYPFYQGGHLLDPVFRGFRTHANNAHNVVLEVASQTGLVGLGVGAWLLGAGAAVFRRKISSLPEEGRVLAWARAAALAGMLADNFFGNVSIFFAVPGFLFAWIAGGLAAQLSGEERASSLRKPFAAGAAVLSALLAAGGIVWAFRAWRAEVDYFEGYKRIRREDLAGATRYLESSRRWRRLEVNNAYELANVYLRQARRATENGLPEESRAALEKAVTAYRDALAANAGYDEIYFNRATALLGLGRSTEAVHDLRASLLINPVNAEGYRLLGSLYARGAGGPSDREELLRRAARALPEEAEFRRSFAEVLAEAIRALARGSRWEEARAKAEELVTVAPEWPTAWLMAADLRAEVGASTEALAAYDRVLALEPSNRAARQNRERLLRRPQKS